MSIQRTFEVAGVDGCKAGWLVAVVSVTKEGTNCVYRLQEIRVAGTFGEILSKTRGCRLICIDIPIGLSDGPPRDCDFLARRILGRPRSSSIFPAPIRPSLSADKYEDAVAITRSICGKGLNKQSFFLLDKIRQVDGLMTPALQRRVREIHPEISFWVLNGKKPMRHQKRKLAGRNERMKLLSVIFSGLEQIVAKAYKPKEMVRDDILDALVAAWTAGQTVIGKVSTLPEAPKFDSKGLRMEILCPACYNR